MKKYLCFVIVLLLAGAFASCSPPADARQSPPPLDTVNAAPSQSVSPSPPDSHETLPGAYLPNSGCGLYEDNYFIVFRNGYDILVYDKTVESVLTALRRCSAFTYSEGIIYYACYDSANKQRCIKAFDIKTGADSTIKNVDNYVPSLLASGGRLYYSCNADSDDELSAELFSILPGGGDFRSEGIRGLDRFCLAGGSIYYTDAGNAPSIYKYSGGDAEKIAAGIGDPYRFEILDSKLYYRDGNDYICAYDTATEKTVQCVRANGWGADFALLGQNIIYIEPGDYVNALPGNLRVYPAETGADNGQKLEGDWYEMYTSGSGAYYSPYSTDGSCRLYSVALSEGKPLIRQIFNYIPDKAPSADTVIFASGWGNIYGGYSDGKWLTHSEAASYCRGQMKLGEYNLAGLLRTYKSSGAAPPDEEYENYVYSRTSDMDPETFDENGFIYLNVNIPESDDEETDTSFDVLNSFCLFSGGHVPDIKTLHNTSKLLPAVQKIVNEHFGKGVVKAVISIAVSADMDGDGKEETLVNSDNNGKAKYDSMWGGSDEGKTDEYEEEEPSDSETENQENWYSLCCMIDDDGSVKIIDEYYGPDYLDESCILYAQNIIDIDEDGVCEVVVSWETWETWGTAVYKYDGYKYNSVMNYTTGN